MKKTIILLSLFSIIILSLFSFKFLDDGDDFEISKSFEIFHNVIREIRLFYVEDTEISKLINESTQELLAKLDPYTVFYPEDKIEDFSFMTTGAYGGVGALLMNKETSLLLLKIYKNSPADKHGLKVGDEITSVNNIKITKNNILEIKLLLKGEPGSKVSVTIKRFGEENILKKTIIREKIKINNIPFSQIIDNKFAYVKLSAFKQGASNDISKSISEMQEKKDITGVILDLRGNPGGLLNEAVNIVNLFVEKGNTIVSTKGKLADWNRVYKATKQPKFLDIPIVVLINSNSASASEIVAGAIQDLDRGVVIGQRSFGKGLVQTTRKMSYNTRIKITTAKYYIPSGRCIQAIDYSHRNSDGSVGHVPDSLISEFKTKKGRAVYDGGGIKPDITVPIDTLSEYVNHLILNQILFDFTTKFNYENTSIASVDSFSITDEIYNDFTLFTKNNSNKVKNKSITYANELLSSAKKEKYPQEIINDIEELRKKLNLDVSVATNIYKYQILPILDKSISERYYYDKGAAIASMEFDNELKEAKKTLINKEHYLLLLTKMK